MVVKSKHNSILVSQELGLSIRSAPIKYDVRDEILFIHVFQK